MAEPVTEEDSWAFRPASITKKKNKKKSLKIIGMTSRYRSLSLNL